MTLGLSFRIITVLILILITYKDATSPLSYVLPRSTLNTRACNMLKQSHTGLHRPGV